MNHQLVNVALIFLVTAFSTSFISIYIFKNKFLGNYAGAFLMALVGAAIGGSVGSFMPVITNRIMQILLPSILVSLLSLQILRWLSVLQEY